MRPTSPRIAALAVSALVVGGAVALGASPAAAASPDVTISQVYGGGGNSGATLTNDFVELRNTSAAAVDLTGWSVQYGSSGGSTWQVTALTGSIPANGYYLVQEAAGTGGSTPLPTPDATGGIAMSGTAGKVALVTNATALTTVCGADCDTAPGVRDLVGYGSAANDFEGAPTGTLSNTTAAIRGAGPDTDNNAADFTVGPPAPRNSGGTIPPPDPGVPGLRIHDIQGAAHLSPKAGVKAADVPGVVTAVSNTGFWFQDPAPDADPATSEGLFVFTSAAGAKPAVGDAVTVTGTVTEFRPGGATSTNLTTTELGSPTVTVVASGQPVPAATLVGPGGLVPPATVIEDDASGEVETTATAFDPATDGLDFWESLEGMAVRIDDAQVVGPTNSFGETVVVPPGSTVRSARGGIVARAGDFNPERIVLAGLPGVTVPAANVKDVYAGPTAGVLDYNFGNYELLAAAAPTLVSGGLTRETTRRAGLLQLSVATFNVENLDPADGPAKFDRLAGYIVGNLAAPDVVALEEVQDNNGPVNDGTVAANVTLDTLTAAITAAGGPRYQWRSIDPENNTDGGEPGGNIRVAFLYRTDRGLSFVDRPGGTATTPVAVTRDSRGKPHLSVSPGRIDPANPAWTSSRKPLAGEFRWLGQTVFVIANHFNSKGGDTPLYGRYQPIREPSATQRALQATAVRGFVDELVAADRRAKVVVLGDLNDFDFSAAIDTLTATGSLVDLPRTLPVPERYTYVFQGNSEVLDHILLSTALAYSPIPACDCLKLFDYDVVHVNSEFADQASDHDPQVVRLLVVP